MTFSRDRDSTRSLPGPRRVYPLHTKRNPEMAPPRLEIAPIKSIEELKTCTPNLMPFHIDYSGKAPISTYLRVEAANETVGAPSPEPLKAEEESDIEAKPKEGADIPEISESTIVGTDAKPSEAAVAPSSPSLVRRVTDATTRFISTFRGRTIQGLKVDLPPGYVGLVLRADGLNATSTTGSHGDEVEKKSKGNRKGKAKPKVKAPSSNAKGRVTRSAARVIDVDEEGVDVDMDVDVDENTETLKPDGEVDDLPDQITTRTLVPSSQFSSFVLWHPDIPVDEARDEYFRSLTEWTRLAHEVRSLPLRFVLPMLMLCFIVT